MAAVVDNWHYKVDHNNNLHYKMVNNNLHYTVEDNNLHYQALRNARPISARGGRANHRRKAQRLKIKRVPKEDRRKWRTRRRKR